MVNDARRYFSKPLYPIIISGADRHGCGLRVFQRVGKSFPGKGRVKGAQGDGRCRQRGIVMLHD